MVPLGLMPAAANDPFAGLGLLDSAGHLGDDLVPGAGFAQVQTQAVFADAGEVPVAFDETGDGELAMQVDDLGLWADPFGGVGIAAQRRDFVAADGNRLDSGLRR